MKRYLLTGNGINIQFDHKDYSAQEIVLRILKNCDRDDFPSHIIVDFPYLLKNYLGLLFIEAREAIRGQYDNYAFGTAEKESLISFKARYEERIATLRITDIGFEDYYLIHDLTCHKTETDNPERFYVREAMKIAYLYAIYNDGKLNQLHLKYPSKFKEYLCNFDSIFTTNYDSNIESATGKSVFHIHGQFDKKSEVYIASSFRNQLPDAPIKDIEIDENYFYLYSNALSTYCGAYKEFQVKQYSQANSCVEKMADAYVADPQMRTTIDEWTLDGNTITANLGYAIQIKAANPEIHFADDYHFDEFKAIQGRLEILGLSPWNDFHIFETIDAASLDECIYYYYDKSECDVVEGLLPNLRNQGVLKFASVVELWESLS